MVRLPLLRKHHNKIKKQCRRSDSHERLSQLLFFHLSEAAAESPTSKSESPKLKWKNTAVLVSPEFSLS